MENNNYYTLESFNDQINLTQKQLERLESSVMYKAMLLFGDGFFSRDGWLGALKRIKTRTTPYPDHIVRERESMVEYLQGEIDYYRFGELVPSGD